MSRLVERKGGDGGRETAPSAGESVCDGIAHLDQMRLCVGSEYPSPGSPSPSSDGIGLLSLPWEMVTRIASHLPAQCIINVLPQVCRVLGEVGEDSSAWQQRSQRLVGAGASFPAGPRDELDWPSACLEMEQLIGLWRGQRGQVEGGEERDEGGERGGAEGGEERGGEERDEGGERGGAEGGEERGGERDEGGERGGAEGGGERGEERDEGGERRGAEGGEERDEGGERGGAEGGEERGGERGGAEGGEERGGERGGERDEGGERRGAEGGEERDDGGERGGGERDEGRERNVPDGQERAREEAAEGIEEAQRGEVERGEAEEQREEAAEGIEEEQRGEVQTGEVEEQRGEVQRGEVQRGEEERGGDEVQRGEEEAREQAGAGGGEEERAGEEEEEEEERRRGDVCEEALPSLERFSLPAGHIADVHSVLLFGGQGALCATGSRDRNVNLWDLRAQSEESGGSEGSGGAGGSEGGRLLGTLGAHSGWVWCLAERDNLLASGAFDSTVRLWDLGAGGGARARGVITGRAPVICLSWQPDGLLAGSHDKKISIYDHRIPQPLVKSVQVHSSAVLSLVADDRYIVSGGKDNTVALYDRRAAKLVNRLTLGSFLLSMSYSGQEVWAGDNQGRIHSFSLHSGALRTLGQFDVGHTHLVTGIHCSPGSLYTCSSDRTIRVHLPSAPPRTLCTLRNPTPVNGLSVEAGVLAVASGNMAVEVWRPPQ